MDFNPTAKTHNLAAGEFHAGDHAFQSLLGDA